MLIAYPDRIEQQLSPFAWQSPASIKARAGAVWPSIVIRQLARRHGDPQGIENGEHVDDFLRDRAGDGRKQAEAAKSMPATLKAMPPTALCSAIDRMRRLMCRNSSTFCSELSRMTTPAASAVISLFWPKAMPTVAAVRAGASLMPSPMKTVGARFVSRADELQLLLRALAGVDLLNADLLGQIADFRFPVAGDEHHALEVMLGAEMPDEVRAFRPRLVAKPQGARIAIVDQDDAFQSAADGRQSIAQIGHPARAVSCGWSPGSDVPTITRSPSPGRFARPRRPRARRVRGASAASRIAPASGCFE